MTAVAGPSSLRAKLYELIDNQAWQDKGTGYCSCPFIESIQDYCLVVRSEEDDSILLSTPVLKEGFYQKQQSTLIVWTERNGSDLALSFQDSNGCGEIWEKIYEIQLQHKHD
ncbi:SMEK 2, suppressor of mek1 (Dictyostelium), partial [Dimargaris verticillata]